MSKKNQEEKPIKEATTNRRIVLSNDIDEYAAERIISSIGEINHHDDKKEKETRKHSEEFKHKREPIELVLNTPGGSVVDGFAIIGAIETSETPVDTVAMGHIMSMGLPIFLAGRIRKAHKLTNFMYHQIRYSAWYETLEGHLQELKFSNQLQKQLDEYILSRCALDQEKMLTTKKEKKDWFFTAKEAKKYGIVEEVI